MRYGERPVNSFIHPAGLPINTSIIEVLRRPVESALTAESLIPQIDDEALNTLRAIEFQLDSAVGREAIYRLSATAPCW